MRHTLLTGGTEPMLLATFDPTALAPADALAVYATAGEDAMDEVLDFHLGNTIDVVLAYRRALAQEVLAAAARRNAVTVR